MWVTMMVAMMLPSLRRSCGIFKGGGGCRAAYFFIWTIFGVVAYTIGIALAASEMRVQGLARAVRPQPRLRFLAGLGRSRHGAQHLGCSVVATPIARRPRGGTKAFFGRTASSAAQV
jgi:hypothetical protein